MEDHIDVPENAPLEAWLAGAVMLLVMAWGAWQACFALADPALADVPRGLDDVRSGVASDKFSKHLDSHLPARDSLIATANAVRYLVLQGAGDKVRLGHDEWLFSVEELAYAASAADQQAKRVNSVEQLSTALAQRGVTLVVALVPDKARVHAQQLSARQYPQWHAQRFASTVNGLHARGVHTVDLASVLMPAAAKSVFYRTDTHWNQDGADLAARAIASQVRTLVTDLPQATFTTQEALRQEARVGDLLRLLGLQDVPDWMRPNPDLEAEHTTAATSSLVRGGLLDDVSVPVVLVGTSYSRRANFHGALMEHLSAEVLNVATDGGGFFKAMHDYLVDQAFATAPPRVLIWELPERVLSEPDAEGEDAGFPITAR